MLFIGSGYCWNVNTGYSVSDATQRSSDEAGDGCFIILAALSEKITAEVYVMDHPFTIPRQFCLTYNVKCSTSIKASKIEYMRLFRDGDDAMLTTLRRQDVSSVSFKNNT